MTTGLPSDLPMDIPTGATSACRTPGRDCLPPLLQDFVRGAVAVSGQPTAYSSGSASCCCSRSAPCACASGSTATRMPRPSSSASTYTSVFLGVELVSSIRRPPNGASLSTTGAVMIYSIAAAVAWCMCLSAALGNELDPKKQEPNAADDDDQSDDHSRSSNAQESHSPPSPPSPLLRPQGGPVMPRILPWDDVVWVVDLAKRILSIIKA
ncbi:hypothetical protein GGR53DRAFT_470048 [Hypoxylon sp. FL1150]|nr:hypothetical protein GGR53DRAFT_470048 [Hypoxylon sp. FL1150]